MHRISKSESRHVMLWSLMIETRHHGYIPHVVLLIVIELPALIFLLPAILSILGDLVVLLQPHRPQHQHGQADKNGKIRVIQG